MARKKIKKLGKAAALLGAAYAASKIGKGTMDGTEGVFPASKIVSDNTMDGTEGVFPASKPKGFRGVIKKMLEGPVANEGPVIPDSMMPMANKGMFVTVKTKMGKNKKTKIC
jgi:hypothetical protein